LFENFDKLYKYNNRRIASGENGYKYFLDNLTSKHAYNTIIKDIHG